MRVAQIVHCMYNNADPELFGNHYHGHYTGLNSRERTKPGVLIAEGYYGIPISVIHTPVGKLRVTGSGHQSSGGYGMEQKILEEDPHFDMVLLKEGYQTKWGYCGPWYQITRVGDNRYPRVLALKDAWLKDKTSSLEEIIAWEQETCNPIYRAAFERGIHNDILGWTDRLLKGERPDLDELSNDLLKHCRNEYLKGFYLEMFHDKIQKLYVGDGIDWERWLSIIYSSTHLNA